MIMKKILFILLTFFTISSCKQKDKATIAFSNKDISNVITRMTDIMLHDVTNPPLASRFFSYACLAGCEIVAENNKNIILSGHVLHDYPSMNKPAIAEKSSYQLAALLAMMEVSKKMQPSGSTMMEEYKKKFLDSCSNAGMDDDIINASQQYADSITAQILKYAKADKYNRISGYNRYQPSNKEGDWEPTPPGFIEAVEPHFNTLRTFTLDSASQFKPLPPVAFSTAKGSPFMSQLMLNYKDSLSKEHKEIAAFWDCNPFAIKEQGHLMMSSKKISPGAHWLGITGIACAKANKSFDETMFINTIVSVGLMDAFISCWDEKYRSNRIRPETAIRKYIDPNWKPLLQTPPFPEYISGHSVVSGASAVILTHFFGDNFSYTDSVEVSYGLTPRNFSSFNEAAKEAAISRFYGGIHYMDAIEKGLDQGEKVGEWVVGKLK